MKILIIRFQKIGDALLTSVLANSLKKNLPDCQVDYLTYSAAAPLLLHHPCIDELHTISAEQRRNPFKYLKHVIGIVGNRYDVIIDAQSTAKSELLSMLSPGAQFRIGRKKQGRGYFYTHTIDQAAQSGNKIASRIALLKPLQDAGLLTESDSQMTISVTEEERQEMRGHLLENGVDLDKPVMVFSVSSSEDYKKWNVDYQVEVATHCIDKYGAQILLYFGSAQEHSDVMNFYQRMNEHPSVFPDVPTPSIRKLAALISHCDMFIGNEGGPRHIAEALKVPGVAVFSPYGPKSEWLPQTSDRYRGIDWTDTEAAKKYNLEKYPLTHPDYFDIMYSVKPQHLIAMVDEVIAQYTDIQQL